MKKVIIFQRIIAHYRKPIFDRLSKIYNLKVVATKHHSNLKPKELDSLSYTYNTGYIKYNSKENSFILDFFTPIIKFKPDVIVHEFSLSILSLLPALILSKLLGIEFILWGHGFNLKKGFYLKFNFRDFLRIFIMRLSDHIILYSQNEKAIIKKFINENKITVAPNTLDTEYFSNLKKDFQIKGKNRIKDELSFNKTNNLVFIGRILEDKKPEICLKILKDFIAKFNNDITLHFVGDGPFLENIIDICNKERLNDNVKFHGKILDPIQTGKILYCSDLMIMPGYLGLSVNHAFCFDCPVVSFSQKIDGPFHSPEVIYVKHNKTGYLADDYYDMKDFVLKYLNDPSSKNYFKENIRNCISEEASIEKMINGFKKCI